MFKTPLQSPPSRVDRFADAIARLVFGGVLLAGFGAMIAWVIRDRQAPAAGLLAASWGLAIIGAWIARAVASRRPEREVGRRASFVVPAVAIALAAPLTLHLPMFVLAADGFREWVVLSLAITAPAHLVFAAQVGRRAYQLAVGAPAITPRAIYLTTVVVSCVPFVLLYGLPPLVVALTGVPLLPLLHRMPSLIPPRAPSLPRAIAHLAA
jgi:hypothetical protein